MSEWIKCSDRMPDPWQSVLVRTMRHGRQLGEFVPDDMQVSYVNRYLDGTLHFRSDLDSNHEFLVSHWMPLPEPPEDSK